MYTIVTKHEDGAPISIDKFTPDGSNDDMIGVFTEFFIKKTGGLEVLDEEEIDDISDDIRAMAVVIDDHLVWSDWDGTCVMHRSI